MIAAAPSAPPRTITAAEAAVRVMESEGVDLAFGIPGASILPLYDALRRSSIRHIVARHEEGATHAADGYARATGKVGVAIATSGPGGTNFVTGLYTAMADSIPIITITGQVPVSQLHREGFQAVDICEIVKPVVKKSFLCKEAAQIPWVFREAFRIARDGRPGPVHIDLPQDVQQQMISYDASIDEPLPLFKTPPSPAKVRRAVEWLANAERPVLMPGGGVILAEAWEPLVALAEHLQLAVSPTLMGKGAIDENNPLYAGIVGIQTSQPFANALFLESDVVCAVGARFASRHTGDLPTYRGNRRFIHVDVEATQIGRIFEPDLGIVADAKLTLEAMLAEARRLYPNGVQRPAWTGRITEARATLARSTDFDQVPVKGPRVFGELNAYYGPDTTFVTAIGLYQIWSGQFQTTHKPLRYFVCGQAGPLGWEISACTGIKLAQPEREVVAVVGDYSFEFLMEEIAVAVQYRIPFVIVMLNNAHLGLIRQAERTGFKFDADYEVSISYGEDGYGMDHVKAMEAMGATGMRVRRPEDIAGALAWAARTSNERSVPVLVEILTEMKENAAMGTSIASINEVY
ncbi:MAG: tartronate-semialdehyde synthase [Candidatus Eremiobacteraeota bacterium]|jgi:tartronate-semialdehyde synthase|nr:tartronate-semialdehyde synthase [Candidatus Eremiobacteraeota bacterium]